MQMSPLLQGQPDAPPLSVRSFAGLLADRGLTAEEVEERRRVYGNKHILGDETAAWNAIACVGGRSGCSLVLRVKLFTAVARLGSSLA